MGAMQGDLHIDMLLSNMLVGYRPKNMIADQIFPIVNVAKESDGYPIFSRADALRVESTERARGELANKITRSVSTDTYRVKNYALDYPFFLEDRANSDPIYLSKIYNGQAQFLFDKLALDWERRIANKVTSGTNVGSYAACASAWTDHTNSDPLGDINTMLNNVEDSTGMRPNHLVLAGKVWREVRQNVTLLNRVFGSNNGGGYLSLNQLQELLEVERILIGGAYQNTANEAQSESLSQVWGANALCYYNPIGNDLTQDEPKFGTSFRWAPPGIPNMQVERHPFDSRRKTEDMEVGYHQDEKIVGASYGFLLTGCV